MKLALMILTVAAMLGCAVTTPQQRMKDCNAKAGDLKGEARKAFFAECLKA